jgi:2-aminoadipate transaminase
MDMVARVLLDPGDVVIVEAPTYPGALHTFRAVGARFAVVPADEDGMVVEALPQVIERCRRETGKAPKLIYSIVNFGNPSGACLTLDRRRTLAQFAAERSIPVLEDDPYGELRWTGEAIAPLFSVTAGGGVLFASSFSKILAPGVRVAWAVADAPLIRKMAVAKQGMDLCTAMVSQVLVHEYCRRGLLDAHLVKIRAHYAAKAEAMARSLRAELPPGVARWKDPEGGFFFWLELRDDMDSSSLFERAVAAGVAFLPGQAFYPAPEETVGDAPDGRRFARLCFTFATPDQIVEGCRRLAGAMGPQYP